MVSSNLAQATCSSVKGVRGGTMENATIIPREEQKYKRAQSYEK
jgi:hypothetical protein